MTIFVLFNQTTQKNKSNRDITSSTNILVSEIMDGIINGFLIIIDGILAIIITIIAFLIVLGILGGIYYVRKWYNERIEARERAIRNQEIIRFVEKNKSENEYIYTPPRRRRYSQPYNSGSIKYGYDVTHRTSIAFNEAPFISFLRFVFLIFLN